MAVDGVNDRKGLGTVRIDDLVQTRRSRVIIDMLVITDRGRLAPKAVGIVERSQYGVVGGVLLFRPLFRIEILVNEELAERKEAELDCVLIHGPALHATHGLCHSPEVVAHVQIILGGHFREADAEVAPELRFQREIRPRSHLPSTRA